MGKRMLVCGGRDFAAREWLWEELGTTDMIRQAELYGVEVIRL